MSTFSFIPQFLEHKAKYLKNYSVKINKQFLVQGSLIIQILMKNFFFELICKIELLYNKEKKEHLKKAENNKFVNVVILQARFD